VTDDRPRPRTFLPDGIPVEYEDFVRCRTNSLDIDSGEVDWLPNMPPITLSFDEGPNGSIIAKVLGAGGWLDLSIPLHIVDGALVADTSDIPALADGVNEWVTDLNQDLKANGMELSGASIVSGQLHVTKQTVAAASTATSAAMPEPPILIPPPPAHVVDPIPDPEPTPPPPAIPPPPAHVVDPIPGREPPSPDESVPHPDQDFSDSHWPGRLDVINRWGKWSRLGAATAGVLVLSVAAWFVFVDDVDPPESSSTAVQTEDASSSGSASDESPPTQSEESGGGDPETGGATGTDAPDSEDESVSDTGGFQETPSVALSEVGMDHGLEKPFVMHRPDTAGDFNGCGPSSAVGADVLGVVAGQEGDRVTAVVWMAAPPTTSDQQFSNAVVLDVVQRSGLGRSMVHEVHNGQRRIGEQDASGNMLPGSDVEITIDDTAVVFGFNADPSDPPVLMSVQGFNLPTDADAVGCDTAMVAARPFPATDPVNPGACIEDETTACLTEDRFGVQVAGTNGAGMIVQAAESDGAVIGEGTTSGFVRVLNGCETNDHFWVFADGFLDDGASIWSTITITDTESGEVKTYMNPLDPLDTTIQDITAIGSCP